MGEEMDRFIVGTGRCGSTLLSKMLRENEQVASLFEYFNGLDTMQRFSREPLDGATFTQMICAVHPVTLMVLARGYPVPEVAYPFDAPGARFTLEGGAPYVLNAMVPGLQVTDPDAFYDELRHFTLALPARQAVDQHRALFDWITGRLEKRVWVERSGGAIDYMGELGAVFPRARFVHIHRAGEEAALSMREHHVFRLGIMLANQLPAGIGRAVPKQDNGAPPQEPDEITQLLESRPPAEYFGRWWTDEVLRGFQALRGLDAGQYHEIRFEELIARPRDVLQEVAHFLDLPDPSGAWLDRAAALVGAYPPNRVEQLPADEREHLQRACRPGNFLLGRLGAGGGIA